MIDELFKEKLIIAGPCTFGTYEELEKNVIFLKGRNIKYLRAGAFKMRTNPNDFQGLRDVGMDMLLRVKEKYDVKIVTEFTTIEQVKSRPAFSHRPHQTIGAHHRLPSYF